MEDIITTSDMDLIMNLLILKHTPLKVEYDDGLVRYSFSSKDVSTDIEKLSRNEQILVDLKDVWAANKIWSMNRSRAKGR